LSPPTSPRGRLGAFAPPEPDWHVVTLRGDADVVLDLSEVEFIDAAIVGVIVRAREFLGMRSRRLTLRSPSACASHVMKLCGVDDRTAVVRGAAVACRAGP
jgi:anti-anti-sigma regulatory factor